MTDKVISSIFSENAKNAIELLKNGHLTYKIRSVEGRTVLDIIVSDNKWDLKIMSYGQNIKNI